MYFSTSHEKLAERKVISFPKVYSSSIEAVWTGSVLSVQNVEVSEVYMQN